MEPIIHLLIVSLSSRIINSRSRINTDGHATRISRYQPLPSILSISISTRCLSRAIYTKSC